MRQVVVLGIGQTQFGRFKGVRYDVLGAQAAKAAIADAGIDPKEIQVAYGSRVNAGLTTIQDCLRHVGITEIEMINTENACGSGISGAHCLWKDIAYGVYDVGIVVGAETLSEIPKGTLASPRDIDGILGQSMPSYFALKARRFLDCRGATAEDLAYPSYKNHKNATMNPYAQYKKELTIEEIVNSRMISDPVTLLECCPSSDGAAAVILCSEEFARKYTTRMIRIASSTIFSGGYEDPQRDILFDEPVYKLAQKAYKAAGIGPEDLDLVELHDAFSPEEIWSYESLGLCPFGEAIPYMRKGTFDIGGKCAVNPSGGLLSLGHPAGASGVRVICEVAQHLRGEAGGRQQEGAKVGMAQMIGGYVAGLTAPAAGGIMILNR